MTAPADLDHFDRVVTDAEIDPVATPVASLAQWLSIHHGLKWADATHVANWLRARALAEQAEAEAEATP